MNNRKARLARTARDVKAAAGDDNPVPDKQRGPVPGSYDSPGSPGDVSHVARIASGDNKSEPSLALARFVDIGSPEFGHCNAGQYVVLVGVRQDEIGRGKVFQVHGIVRAWRKYLPMLWILVSSKLIKACGYPIHQKPLATHLQKLKLS